MNLKVPIKQRILKSKLKLVRSLSSAGKILVKTGAVVKPEDVVAEGIIAPGFRSVPIAASLGLSESDAVKFLKVKPGDKVFTQQPIAIRKKLFGQTIIKSPIEGIVKDYDSQTGFLRIEFLRQREKLTAACWGKVTKVTANQSVEIETQVLRICGIVGTGRAREGQLKVITKPADFLLPNLITQDLANSLIFGGAQITRAALAKALSLGVAGIVAGGIGASDFAEAGGGKLAPYWSSSDVGITVVILEGFGLRMIDGEVYGAIEASNGKFAIIDGDQAEIILPQAESVVREPAKFPEEKVLKVGDIVKITDPAHLGITGKVTKLADQPQVSKIGLTNYLVEIETFSGKIVEPYTNLEILI